MSTCNGKTPDCEIITVNEIDTVGNCYTNQAFDPSDMEGPSIVPVRSVLDCNFVMVNRNVLSKSDLSEDVRAKLDAKHYFNQMTVQLGVSTVNFSHIVTNLLTEVRCCWRRETFL